MVAAGVGDGVRQPGFFGVVAPHDALQLGEFVDHFRGQIGLGDFRGQSRFIRIGPNDGRDFTGQGGDAGNAFGLRAKFVVEGDIGQGRAHGLKALIVFGALHRAHVIFPKEFRI